eukprot:m.161713 g.161713  ORF g.161713 m.161713 type:complete len:669 (+) comp12109_c0_seq1:178-2184(+)
MSTSVKVYFASRSGEPDDVRRFTLDPPLDYAVLAAKVQALFGVTAPGFTWTDEDGDTITIGHTDDLVEAARSSSGTLKIRVTGSTVALDGDGASDGWERVESSSSPTPTTTTPPAAPEVSAPEEPTATAAPPVEDSVNRVTQPAVEPVPVTAPTEPEALVPSVTDPVEVEVTEPASAAPAPTTGADEPVAEKKVVHPRVQCDVTGMFPIEGNRWHKIGADYDLCDEAFQALHVSQKENFELIRSPGALPLPYTLTVEESAAASASAEAESDLPSHPHVTCDVCNMVPIRGNRWHLTGHNYDLCQADYDKLTTEQQQRFVCMATPVDRSRCLDGYPIRISNCEDAAREGARLMQTVVMALQNNYTIEINLVPRDEAATPRGGPVQAEVPIRVDVNDDNATVTVGPDNTTPGSDVAAAMAAAVQNVVAAVTANATASASAHACGGGDKPCCGGAPRDKAHSEKKEEEGACHNRWKRAHRHRMSHGGRCGNTLRSDVPAGDVLPDAPLSIGQSGEGVRQLQTALFRLGLLGVGGPGGVGHRWHGFFGPRTAGALRAFQTDNGLTECDGVYNEDTRTALLRVLSTSETVPSDTPQVDASAPPASEQLQDLPAVPVPTAPEVPVSEPEPVAHPKWREHLHTLRMMGFDNADLLIPMLDRHNGNCEAVVAELLD